MKKPISIFIIFIVIFVFKASGQTTIKLNPSDDTFTYKKINLVNHDFSETKTENVKSQKDTILFNKSSSSSMSKSLGSLTVSETGAAIYEIPIEVPRGINGVQPAISINYNSQSGSGIAGKGWNIKGISSIKELPATDFHGDFIDHTDPNDQFMFALDGQVLFLTSVGDYGGDNVEYKTEQYSNLRITSHGSVLIGGVNRPEYFKVYYPDGSIAEYGKYPSSRSINNYSIAYWQNPQGLRISYSYSLNNGSQYLEKISYGNLNSGLTPNEITFDYVQTNHGRSEQSYVKNASVRKNNVLKKVNTFSNGVKLKSYELFYETLNAPLKYPKLISINEKNEIENKVLANLSLDYKSYGSENIQKNTLTTDLNLSSINNQNAIVTTLDWNSNNDLDFFIQPTDPSEKDKIWLYQDINNLNIFDGWQINTGDYETIFPTTLINHSDKLLSQDALTIVDNGFFGFDPMEFKVYAYLPSNPGGLTPQYVKTYSNHYNDDFCDGGNLVSLTLKVPEEYISGDFNGDGFTDVLAISKPYSYTNCQSNCACYDISVNEAQVNLIELRQDKPTNFITNVGDLQEAIEDSDKIDISDFNGDGKTDLWIRKDGQVKIYGLDNENNLQLLSTINNSTIQTDKEFLIGDYNGDGKSDFMVPQGNNSNVFRTFISRGNSVFSSTKTQPFIYKKGSWDGTDLTNYIYIPSDINGDGKTDIVVYKSETQNFSTTGSQDIKAYKNEGYLASEFNVAKIRFSLIDQDSQSSVNLIHYPLPVFINSNKPNRNLELAIFSDSSIHSFDFNSDYRRSLLIEKFETFGNEYFVDYKEIVPNNQNGSFLNIYQSSYSETYPYVNIQVAPSFNVVSEIRRDLENSTIKKFFLYNDAVFHNEGLGFLGFRGLVSTNWHVDVSDRIYTISIYDPHLRGALIKQYERDYFAGFNDDTDNFITRKILEYTSIYDDDNFYTIKLDSEHFEDKVKDTYLYSLYQYDDFFNVRRIDKINDTGSTTTTIDYYNSSSLSDYYRGRKDKVVNFSNIDGETFSTTTDYTYQNNLIDKVHYSGNETQTNVETFNYDPYGNVVEHNITPHNEQTRSVNYEYDSSGRFLVKSIDELGRETLFNYDNNTGLLLSTIDHLNHDTSYNYDEWYRVTEVTDYLGNQTVISYEKISGAFDPNEYRIRTVSDDGSETESIYNTFGNLVLSKSKDILGDWVKVSHEYDDLGRPYKVSEPYKGGNPTQWNETEYDFYGRTINQYLYTGKTISINYNGLTTTVDDGTKVVSSTIDDFGRTVSVTDPGGTINYEYYANGGLKSSNFSGVVVQVEQDGWGRRTSLNDPSAGIYEYEYNGFGEITKEITPKGQTEYFYSDNGLLEEKLISGDNTFMSTTYIYQEDTKFLELISTLTEDGNNASYQYEYDTKYRISSIEETTPYANFKKNYEYDGFGRVIAENYQAMDVTNGRESSKSINYSYQNGYLKKMFDSNNDQNIFEVNKVNHRGQLTDAIIGSEEILNRVYDEYGYIKENQVYTFSSVLMERSTDFDPVTGNLLNRSNSVFSWSESFEYDDLDRLLSSSDNNGTHIMQYDDYGRVTSDNHVGDFNYSDTSYQIDDIDLNIRGDLHYQRNSLQQISYNAYKKPHEIYDEDIERITFQYNAFEQRSNMFYGGLEEDAAERRMRKHYSFDGSMEIIHDNETGVTTFTTYIGGDAYNAPAIWKSVQGGEQEQEGSYYFLHRDYLGSIVLITDGNGNAIENRHFDAWGKIVKLTDGEGKPLEKLTITDRGYTGHEHLHDVDLIHMNGRLYDPNLKRMLSPDNYIQDMSRTQNYNRYAYVLNNPLKYVDPSGMMFENGNGLSNTEQSFIGNLLSTAHHFLKDATIGRWFNNAVGKPIENAVNSFLDWVGGWFKKSDKQKTISVSNYEALNNDPMVGPSTRVQDSFFDGGGDIVGSLGVFGRNALEFTLARVGAWQKGFNNSKKFLWGLITLDSTTYGNIKDGFVTLSDPVLTLVALTNAYVSVSNTIDRIPEMSPSELGGLYGDIEFIVAESLLFSKGAGAVANGVKGLKFLKAAKSSSTLAKASQSAFNAADDVGSIFIKNKHLNIGSGKFAKFNTSDVGTARGIVQDALRSPNAQFLPNPNLPNTFRVHTNLVRVVGTKGQTSVRVIVGFDGKVINAFPIK